MGGLAISTRQHQHAPPTYIAICLAPNLADDSEGAMAWTCVSMSNMQQTISQRAPIFSSTSYLSSSGMIKVVLLCRKHAKKYAFKGGGNAGVLVGWARVCNA